MNVSNVTEKILEDIFTTDVNLLGNVLSINASELSLIARQKRFEDKKILDMLYLHKDNLLLIELKAVPFYDEIIPQINHYEAELKKLQNNSKLIRTDIDKIILVTDAKQDDFKKCDAENIKLIKFSIEDVLGEYYLKFKELSAFLNIEPASRGVTRLYLIKSTIELINKNHSFDEICDIENLASNTIHNRLAVSNLLNIIDKPNRNKREYNLTNLGKEILKLNDNISEDRFNAQQINLIANFVKENPFYSQITFSIMSVVETIFILSKAEYPVKYDIFQDFFIKSLGKNKTWKQPKAQLTGTYHFTNYAEELGFIQRIDNKLFLTPLGIQSILLFQLNRSIKLINARI